MDARTAESHFKEADSLYRDGRYFEALDRLIELDEAYPNTPNILFPLARCLRRVGRMDESLAICDDLITRCGDMRAMELREFIRKSHAPSAEESPDSHYSIEGLNQDAHAGVFDDLLTPGPQQPPALPGTQGPGTKRKYTVIGVLAVTAVLLLIAWVMGFKNGSGATAPHAAAAATLPEDGGGTMPDAEKSPPAERDNPQVREHARAADNIMFTALGIVIAGFAAGNILVLFFTLTIRGKLPYEQALDNLLNAGFVGVGLAILNAVFACLGLIPSYFLLRKLYGFELVDFLVWFGLNAAVCAVLGLVVMFFSFIMIA